MYLSALTVVYNTFLLPVRKVQTVIMEMIVLQLQSRHSSLHIRRHEAVVMALYGDATETIVFSILT